MKKKQSVLEGLGTRSTHHLDTVRKHEALSCSRNFKIPLKTTSKKQQDAITQYSTSLTSEKPAPSSSHALPAPTAAAPQPKARPHWLAEQRDHQELMRRRQKRVDAERQAREKDINRELQAYLKRVRDAEERAEQATLENEMKRRYFDKAGAPIGLSGDDIRDAFTIEDLEEMRLALNDKLRERSGLPRSKPSRAFRAAALRQEASEGDSDSLHLGFQRFEELLKELRADYDRHSDEVSQGLLRACGHVTLDGEARQRRLRRRLELTKPRKR